MNTAPIRLQRSGSFFCTTLRDDGVGYGRLPGSTDATLFFLKMADEYAKPP